MPPALVFASYRQMVTVSCVTASSTGRLLVPTDIAPVLLVYDASSQPSEVPNHLLLQAQWPDLALNLALNCGCDFGLN